MIQIRFYYLVSIRILIFFSLVKIGVYYTQYDNVHSGFITEFLKVTGEIFLKIYKANIIFEGMIVYRIQICS